MPRAAIADHGRRMCSSPIISTMRSPWWTPEDQASMCCTKTGRLGRPTRTARCWCRRCDRIRRTRYPSIRPTCRWMPRLNQSTRSSRQRIGAGSWCRSRCKATGRRARCPSCAPTANVVPAGSMGQLDGGGEFIVGIRWEAFIKGLAGSNQVTIDLGEGSCHASFAFKPRPGNAGADRTGGVPVKRATVSLRVDHRPAADPP